MSDRQIKRYLLENIYTVKISSATPDEVLKATYGTVVNFLETTLHELSLTTLRSLDCVQWRYKSARLAWY